MLNVYLVKFGEDIPSIVDISLLLVVQDSSRAPR